jgi:hypothetical protein
MGWSEEMGMVTSGLLRLVRTGPGLWNRQAVRAWKVEDEERGSGRGK